MKTKTLQAKLSPRLSERIARLMPGGVPTGWAPAADGRCFTCGYFDRSKSHCQKHSGLTTPDNTCEDYNFALVNRQECSTAGLMAEPNQNRSDMTRSLPPPEVSPESCAAGCDPITELCEMIRLSGARVVFWTCPDCPTSRVTWDHAKDKSTPRCEQCGKQGDPR